MVVPELKAYDHGWKRAFAFALGNSSALALCSIPPEQQNHWKPDIMKTISQCLQTGLLLSAATLSAQAGSFSSDFNSGLPAGATLYGTAVVEPTGGVGDSGCLKLTKAINSQSGSIVLDD